MKVALQLTAFWLLSTTAYAQSQPTAQDKYEEAKARYNIGDYEAALAGFKEAYLVSRVPELLLDIAQCHRFLRHKEEAIRALQSYLSEAPESPYVPEVKRLIQELSSPSSAPTSTRTPQTQEAPKEPPPSANEQRQAKVEAIAATTALGAFTGVTGAVFLARNPDFNKTVLFTAATVVGAAGGVGLGLLYSELLHKEGQRKREVHPLVTGLLLGAGEGVTGSLFLQIDKLGPQAVLSATYFSTSVGLIGGVVASELYDPSPGDSWLVLSGGAWGLFFGEAAVGAAQLDLPLLNDLAVSGLFNAGLLGAGAWSWFVDANPRRVFLVDAAGLAGAASGVLVGGLLQHATSELDGPPLRGASIGGLVGGAVGLSAGLLVSKRWAAKRPRLRLVEQALSPSFVGVLPVVKDDGAAVLEAIWALP